jgi:hypothetical protein
MDLFILGSSRRDMSAPWQMTKSKVTQRCLTTVDPVSGGRAGTGRGCAVKATTTRAQREQARRKPAHG